MKRYMLIHLFIGLCLLTSHGQVPESDSLALVALYNSTNGAGWTNNMNWLQPSQPVSTWYGITVYNNKVEQIRLSNNNLTGTLPEEIGDFNDLKNIDVKGNQISGSIPSTIGKLTELTNLWLRGNQLTGPIPVEIGDMVSLIGLNLSYNQLSDSIPPGIGNLANLETMLLHSNQLNCSIPAEICNLSNLTQLILCGNQLSDSIPSFIGDLTKLTEINLSKNFLTGSVPPGIGNLSNLAVLDLSDNQLTGSIPSEIGNLTGLTYFAAYKNQFNGPIPPEIWNLTELTTLLLNNNDLTGTLPAEVKNLPKLQYFFLHSNQIDGNIPTEIGNLRMLLNLNLAKNNISGSIPHEIGNLDSLRWLSLESNELTENIPPEISNLKKLKGINLRGNQLRGSIPVEIGNLNNLESIDLNNNKLSGRIPDGIRSLPNLTTLKIDNNNFNFFDLEPLIGISIGTYIYYPQGFVELNTDHIYSALGNDLDIDITNLTLSECSATNNQYQWWKDGLSITDYSDSPVLGLTGLESSDEGLYHCTMINSDFPDLILVTESFPIIIDGPTDILLTPDSIDENVVSGTMVGLLSAEDPNQTEGHVFTLIEGNGINDAGNDLFSIGHDTLFINTSPDYEIQQEYSIYMRATDDDSKTFDKALVIYVNDIQESEPDAYITHDEAKQTIHVFPNPIADHIVLEYELDEKATITVQLFSLQGRLLKTLISYEIRMAGSNEEVLTLDPTFPQGNYLLVFHDNTSCVSIPIIIQK